MRKSKPLEKTDVSIHETPDETDNNRTQLEQITNSSTTGRHVV